MRSWTRAAISPLDVGTLAASARRTGRAVVCAEDALMAGCTAEITYAISERCFSDLSAPVRRLAALDVPMPFSASLADRVVPSVEQIVETVKDVVNGH